MRHLALLLLALAPRVASAQVVRATDEWVFPSGLRVVLMEDHRFPVSRVVVGVKAGEAQSPADAKQLAHVAEHVWFRSMVGDATVAQGLDALGCESNASTSADVTTYESSCPASRSSEQLALLMSVLDGPWEGLDTAIVDSEKATVAQEIRERADRGTVVYDAALRALFDEDHPYFMPDDEVGAAADVTAGGIAGFVEANYLPDRSTIVVHGDMSSGTVAAVLRDHLDPTLLHPELTKDNIKSFPAGSLQFVGIEGADTWYEDPSNPGQPLGFVAAPSPTRATIDAMPQPRLSEITVEAPTPRAYTALAFSLPPADTYTYWPMYWLAPFAEADLRMTIGGQKGIEGVRCDTRNGALATVLLCSIEHTADAKIDKIIGKAKSAFVASYTMKREDVLTAVGRAYDGVGAEVFERDSGGMDTVMEVARHELLAQHPMYYARKYKRDVATELGRYRELAATYMAPDQAVVIKVKPGKALADAPMEQTPSFAATGAPAASAATDPEGSLLGGLGDLTPTTYDNGVTFLPVVSDGLGLTAYSILQRYPDDADPALLNLLGGSAFQSFYTTGGGAKLQAYLDTTPGAQVTTYVVRGSLKLGSALSALTSVLSFEPPKKIAGATITQAKEALEGRWRTTAYWSAQAAWQALSGADGVLGLTPDDLDAAGKTSQDDLIAFYKAMAAPERVSVVAVGRLGDDVDKTAKKVLAGLKGADAPADSDGDDDGDATEGEPTPTAPAAAPAPLAPWTGGEATVLIDAPSDHVNTSVDLYCPLDLTAVPAEQASATAAITATLVGKALYSTLRETSGVVYTPQVDAYMLDGHWVLHAQGTTPVSTTAGVAKAMRSIIADAAATPASAEALSAARTGHVEAVRMSFASHQGVARKLGAFLGNGGSLDAASTYVEGVNAIDAAAITATLSSCPGHTVVTVVGSGDAGKALTAAGIQHTVLDANAALEARLSKWFPKSVR